VTQITGKLKERFFGFFFTESDASALGICRFLFCGFIFVFYLNTNFADWAPVPDELWHPIFLFDIFNLPVFSATVLKPLGLIWFACVFLSAVGFLSRPATFLSFVIGFYLIGMTNSFSKTHHMETVVLFVFGILAFSRCGDGFSLDRIIKSRRGAQFSRSWEYAWPVNLIQALMTFFFCAAGLSKLRNSGLEWVFSGNLSNLFISGLFGNQRHEPLSDWLTLTLAQKNISVFLAATTLMFELSAPLALFGRRLKTFIGTGLFFMMTSFWVIMGLAFPQWIAAFVFWLPWDSVIRRTRIK